MKSVRRFTNSILNVVSTRAISLCAALIFSAYLTTLATAGGGQSWLGWFSLLPLFQAIRVLAPTPAAACGGLWGISTLAFGFGAVNSESPLALSAALMTVAPALYTGLGAWLTRRIGFSPYLLALGWMGVEVAIQPLGLHNGLLAATQGDQGFLINVIGSFAGYVLIAFVVAYFNAALLSAIVEVRVSGAAIRRVAGIGIPQCRVFTSETPLHPAYLISPAQPRAPPA